MIGKVNVTTVPTTTVDPPAWSAAVAGRWCCRCLRVTGERKTLHWTRAICPDCLSLRPEEPRPHEATPHPLPGDPTP